MEQSERLLRKIIREEIQYLINETTGVGDVISKPAYQQKLQSLGLSDRDVDRIETGSTIGYGAPGGYVMYLNRRSLSKNEISQMTDSTVRRISVDGSTGNLKIHFK